MSSYSPPIIDTHAHLDDAAFDKDRAAVIERGRAAGVQRFLNIAYRPDIWNLSVALREAHPEVELAAGIHPQDAGIFSSRDADKLAERLLDLRPLGIGEAGFDFARSGPTIEQQTAAFRWQIELAVAKRLPLIIHQREASTQLVQELDRWPQLERVVLHSFDGDARLATWALERGFFAGIGGLACRKGSTVLRDALTILPVVRLLLETDAPYLAPPGSPSRRNEPSNLPIVAGTLAPLWNLTPSELCNQTTENAMMVFGFSGRG